MGLLCWDHECRFALYLQYGSVDGRRAPSSLEQNGCVEETMVVEAGCATSGASPVTIVVAIERLRQAAEGVDLRKSLQM
jgi:hypothetical protein